MNKRNSLAIGTALMAVALAFTGQFESAGGNPHLTAYRDQGRRGYHLQWHYRP